MLKISFLLPSLFYYFSCMATCEEMEQYMEHKIKNIKQYLEHCDPTVFPCEYQYLKGSLDTANTCLFILRKPEKSYDDELFLSTILPSIYLNHLDVNH